MNPYREAIQTIGTLMLITVVGAGIILGGIWLMTAVFNGIGW